MFLMSFTVSIRRDSEPSASFLSWEKIFHDRHQSLREKLFVFPKTSRLKLMCYDLKMTSKIDKKTMDNNSSDNSDKHSPTTVSSSPPSHFVAGNQHKAFSISDILAKPTKLKRQSEGNMSPSRDKSSNSPPPPSSSSAMNSPASPASSESSSGTVVSSGTDHPPSSHASLSSGLDSLPRFSFPPTGPGMTFFNPATASEQQKLAAAQQFYSWPHQAGIWRDRLDGGGKITVSSFSVERM